MHFLLITIGSHGDVHPFVGLGGVLRRRGHRVTLAANEHFKPLVESAQLEFVQLGSEAEFIEAKSNPDLWHWNKGTTVVLRMITPLVRRAYEIVAAHAVAGETIVVASSLGLGARVAQDKLGIPTAMVHLSPAVFRSIAQPPTLPGAFTPWWMPRSVIRRAFALGDRFIIDPLLAPPINELRSELGLPPVHGIFRDYINGAPLVIGLFPEWFAPPAPDWPPQVRLTGFPLYDEAEIAAMSSEVYDFLNAGDPPVVFTPGSANHHAHKFFAAAIEACRRLRLRGMLVTRHREHIPRDLPATFKHIDYAPFSQLFPHAAAVVHHGGIGTSAQALAAGSRQMITPMAHDQPDNAARLVKLGVARSIPLKRLTARKLARSLDLLLADRAYHIRAHWVSQWFKGQQPLVETAGILEQLGKSVGATLVSPAAGEASLPPTGQTAAGEASLAPTGQVVSATSL